MSKKTCSTCERTKPEDQFRRMLWPGQFDSKSITKSCLDCRMKAMERRRKYAGPTSNDSSWAKPAAGRPRQKPKNVPTETNAVDWNAVLNEEKPRRQSLRERALARMEGGNGE